MMVMVIAISMVFSLFSPGYCINFNNWGNTDLNPLLKREIPYDLIYTGLPRGGVSTVVSTVSNLTSAMMGFSVYKLNGAEKTFGISNGVAGKQITFIKIDTDDHTLAITKSLTGEISTTATGWSTLTFATAAGSYVTLTWIDSTIGWIVTGSSGITITP